MDWLELVLNAKNDVAAERAALLMRDCGIKGCWFNEGAVISYLPEETASWQTIDALSVELAELRAAGIGLGELRVHGRRELEWADNWKKYFKINKIGRIVIRPSWEDYTPEPGEAVMDLDPGMAFGTGAHPTTVMCLQMIDHYLKAGWTVLDIGTGSAILSILSARLGAASVFACDIDSVAVEAAQQNIIANSVSGQVSVVQGGVDKYDGPLVDMILANITADVIKLLLPDMKRCLKPDGCLLLSGIIDTLRQDVLTVADKNGFQVFEERKQGEWIALALRRRET